MTPEEFRSAGHELIDWIADQRAAVGEAPVLAQVAPGEVRAGFASAPPSDATGFHDLLRTLDEVVVPGLEPWVGENAVITVEVVTDETASDIDLGVRLGMPRDLDRDGIADNGDVRDTGRMLPVVVRARWLGASGPRQIEQGFFVLGYGS